MTTTNIVIDHLKQELEEHQTKYAMQESELQATKDVMDALQQVLNYMTSTVGITNGSAGLHSHIRISQLTHCNNQREMWRAIARLSGGYARPNEGAQLIIDAGLSTKPKRSVMSNASNYMSRSDQWEWADKGRYRLLENVPGGQSDDDEGDSKWTEQSSLSDDGDAWPPTYRANGETVVDMGRIIV